jgi:hypothetical protein
MVLGLRTARKGAVDGIQPNTQLNTQAAAVTAVAYTATGAIAEADTVVDLNHSSVKIEATIAAPRPGRLMVITQIDTGTAAHTVTLTQGTFDGTNNTATFNAQYEALVLLGISDKRFLILKNYGSVALSAV